MNSTHELLEPIKKMMSQQIIIEYKGKVIKTPYRTTGIGAGMLAYAMIVSGVLTLEINLWIGITKILYAFLIILPMSYLQIRQAEKYESINNPIGNK